MLIKASQLSVYCEGYCHSRFLGGRNINIQKHIKDHIDIKKSKLKNNITL